VGSQRLVIATLPAVAKALNCHIPSNISWEKNPHNSNISCNLLIGEHSFTIVILFVIEASRWKQWLAVTIFAAIGPKKKML
jgi:hypothetical protein